TPPSHSLSLHDALPISWGVGAVRYAVHARGQLSLSITCRIRNRDRPPAATGADGLDHVHVRVPVGQAGPVIHQGLAVVRCAVTRSEEHTSELQSLAYIV